MALEWFAEYAKAIMFIAIVVIGGLSASDTAVAWKKKSAGNEMGKPDDEFVKE